jgi:hypothetical protein
MGYYSHRTHIVYRIDMIQHVYFIDIAWYGRRSLLWWLSVGSSYVSEC